MSENRSLRKPALRWIVGMSVLGLITASVCAWFLVKFTRATDKPVSDGSTPMVTKQRIQKPGLPEDGYVGSQACAKCHESYAQSYQRHPMSRSLTASVSAIIREDSSQQNRFVSGPCEYRVELVDNKLIHHESLKDSDGSTLYDISATIDYVVGSGARGRAYLTQHSDILTMSSIGWYAGKGWDLSPGYRPEDHPHFNRRVTESCLQCHAGRFQFDRNNANHFPTPIFIEMSIGCERCHGPGQKHVSFHESHAVKSGSDPIVNPVKLPPSQREAVCNQCHLQAQERIPRYGRSHPDFRPGQHLNENWTIFLKADLSAEAKSAELISQVEQMQASRCYQVSQAKMGCTSCHNSHDFPAPAERPAFYQKKCLNCHEQQGCSLDAASQSAAPASGSCIHCHMPSGRTSNVPHTSTTDHRILRDSRKRSPKLKVPPLTWFAESGFSIPDIELERAKGLMLTQLAEETRDRTLAPQAEFRLKKFLEVAPDDTVVLEALGVVCQMQSRPREAIEYWERILAQHPDHEQALLRLTTAAQDARRSSEAKSYGEKYVRINPTLPQLQFKYAQALADSGDLELAMPFALQASRMFPRRLALYEWLEQANAKLGHTSEAEKFRVLREKVGRRLNQDRSTEN